MRNEYSTKTAQSQFYQSKDFCCQFKILGKKKSRAGIALIFSIIKESAKVVSLVGTYK